MQDENWNGFIEYLDEGWRVVQCVVTAESFYVSRQGCYDGFLVTVETRVESGASVESAKSIPVWFKRALAFVRVLSDHIENNVCRMNDNKSRTKCAFDPKKKICF